MTYQEHVNVGLVFEAMSHVAATRNQPLMDTFADWYRRLPERSQDTAMIGAIRELAQRSLTNPAALDAWWATVPVEG